MKQLFAIIVLLFSLNIVSAQSVNELKQQLDAAEGAEKVVVYTALIHASLKKNDIRSAINYGRSGFELAKASNVQRKIRGNLHWAWAKAYHRDTNYGKAVKQYKEALLYIVATDSQEANMQVLVDMASAQKAMNQKVAAIEHYKLAMKTAEHIKDYQMQSFIYTAISEIYGELGKYKDAFEYFRKVAELQQKRAKQEEEQRLKLIQVKADLAQMEKEKKELELRNKELELKRVKKTQHTLKNQVKKKNEAIEELSETTKLQSDSIKAKEAEVEEKNRLVELERENLRVQKRSFLYLSVGAFGILIISIVSFRLYLITRKQNNLLRKQNVQIRNQKDEIEKQKLELENKNEEIGALNVDLKHKNDTMSASIRYAQRIQKAILPHENESHVLGEHFILWRPRDVVSGDFYWYAEVDDKLVVVAADCTGHGVPGAFMSALGVAFLNDIVKDKKTTMPNEILEQMREDVIQALGQSKSSYTKDGMDLACVMLDKKARKIWYSGAYNPLYIISDAELQTHKADPMPIAIHPKMRPFTIKQFAYKPGDLLYIFSDGITDQFGGKNGLKFGARQLKKMLLDIHPKTMERQAKHIENRYDDWMGKEHGQLDDMLLMGIKLH